MMAEMGNSCWAYTSRMGTREVYLRDITLGDIFRISGGEVKISLTAADLHNSTTGNIVVESPVSHR